MWISVTVIGLFHRKKNMSEQENHMQIIKLLMSEFHLKATHCSVIGVVGPFSEAVLMNKQCNLTTMRNTNAIQIKYFLLCTGSSEAHTDAKSVNNFHSLICKPSSGAGLLWVLRYHHLVIAGYTNSKYELRVDLKCVSIILILGLFLYPVLIQEVICNHTPCSYFHDKSR